MDSIAVRIRCTYGQHLFWANVRTQCRRVTVITGAQARERDTSHSGNGGRDGGSPERVPPSKKQIFGAGPEHDMKKTGPLKKWWMPQSVLGAGREHILGGAHHGRAYLGPRLAVSDWLTSVP